MALGSDVSTDSNLQQQLVSCDAGFTGKKLQQRIKDQDGNWSNWIEIKNTCTCAPTSKTQVVSCTAPLKGTKTEKSNWVCSDSKTGSWSAWSTTSSSCYTPCTPLPTETRYAACPADYVGSRTEQRTSSCSADDTKPPTWSGWGTTSFNCTYSPPPPPVYGPSCPYYGVTVSSEASANAITSSNPGCYSMCSGNPVTSCTIYGF